MGGALRALGLLTYLAAHCRRHGVSSIRESTHIPAALSLITGLLSARHCRALGISLMMPPIGGHCHLRLQVVTWRPREAERLVRGHLWCWCEPGREVCKNLVVLNVPEQGATGISRALESRGRGPRGWGVERVDVGMGGWVPHAITWCSDTRGGKETLCERPEICHLLLFMGELITLCQMNSSRLRAGVGGDGPHRGGVAGPGQPCVCLSPQDTQ